MAWVVRGNAFFYAMRTVRCHFLPRIDAGTPPRTSCNTEVTDRRLHSSNNIITTTIAVQPAAMSSPPFTNPFDSAGFTFSHVPIPAPTNDPDVSVSIFYRHFKPPASSSTARPLLLLHGYPQTHVIWSDVAPVLAASGKWEIVIPDNRGVGKSSAPPPRSDGVKYSRYSKREMARDMVELMRSLGHEKFWVVAHDRGARVAHRLGLDWPEKLNKLIMLDIAPTVS